MSWEQCARHSSPWLVPVNLDHKAQDFPGHLFSKCWVEEKHLVVSHIREHRQEGKLF